MRTGVVVVRNPLTVCAFLLGAVAILAAAAPGPSHPMSPPQEPGAWGEGAGGPIPTQMPGFFDTTEFMIGTVRVGVILLESDGTIDTETESWTAAERTNVQNEIQAALDWWVGRASSFGIALSFSIDWTYVNSPITTGYEPINRCGPCGSGQALWIQAAMNALGSNVPGDYFTDVRNYDNVLRNSAGTNWAYTIFVVDSSNDADNQFTDGFFAYAYLGGPFLVMTYGNDGWGIGNMDQVAAHESGHIFYALDEYAASGCTTTQRSGYLNRKNDNCANGGTGATNVMLDNFLGTGSPRIEAREMIGWRDTDGDGIEDILDTEPNTTLNAYAPDPSPDDTPTYTGSAQVVPLTNNNPNGPGNDVTIDTMKGVQFNVDGGTWTAASSSDGAFDEAVESFTFTTPAMGVGTHTICARASNEVGNVESSPSCDQLTIADTIPPTADAGPNEVTDEGVAVSLDGSGSTDNVGVTTWEWDFDAADGVSFTPPDATGVAPSHVYGDNGVYTVTLQARDAAGNAGTDTATVSVTNKGPSVSIGGPYSGSEGSPLSVTGTATDLGSDDLTFTWTWGDGTSDTVATYYNNGIGPDLPHSPGGTFPFTVSDSPSHVYGDNGAYSLTLRVCDDDGGCTFSSATVTVGNANPTVSAGGPYAEDEGTSLVVTGTATDPGSDDLTFVWSWGDGTPDTVMTYFNDGVGPDPFPNPGGTFPFSVADTQFHVYGDNGVYTIAVTVCDDDGGCDTASVTATIRNVAPAPSVDSAFQPHLRNLPAGHFYPLDSITFSGSATDEGSDDLTFTWNFGDGTVVTSAAHFNDGVGPDPFPSPGGTFPFSASESLDHTYALPGDYTVTLTVTDDDGGVSSTQMRIHITSPAELKHEAIQRIKALKVLALARGDMHLVHELDQAEEEVWRSLGYEHPFHPKSVAEDVAPDVSVKKVDRDMVELTLGPSWDARLASYNQLRLIWANGDVTVIDLPRGWPTKDLHAHVRPWVDAWQQDVRVDWKLGKKGALTLTIHVHGASLGFAVSLDADRVATLSFTYQVRPWWIDDAHLDSKDGKHVFDEEKDAVKHLIDRDEVGSGVVIKCRLQEKMWRPAERADLGKECDAIANLPVKADELLARIALADALETPVKDPKQAKHVQHEIEKAQQELAKAYEEWDEHEYDHAVDHFKKAWEHAEHAIKHALRE